MNKILIIAPHPDDEVLGCGGIIAKNAAKGNDVYVVIVTNAYVGAPEMFTEKGTEKVRIEARNSHQFLGVKETLFLDFPAPRLDTIPSYKLSIALLEIINKLKIDTLYIPHRGDIHKDHRVTFEAALVAARPINNCPVNTIYAYETVSETEWAAPFGDDVFIPTVFEDITPYIEKKKKAFTYFTAQERKFPHPRSLQNLEYLSKLRGATVGFNNAEAFMLVRSLIK